MNRNLYLGALSLLCVASMVGTIHARGGGGGSGGHGGGGGAGHGGGGGGALHTTGGSFHGSDFHGGSFHGSDFHDAGSWHGGGGIAGGGWHQGGLPGVAGSHWNGIGGFPSGIGHAGGLGGIGYGHDPSRLPIAGAGFGGFGGQPGYGQGWHGGLRPYPWYNGHWHNHWNGSGFGGFGGYGGGWGYPFGSRYPLGWGLGGWGLGSLWYNSGYTPYYNPYYTAPPIAAGGWSYSQPIPVGNAYAVAADEPDDVDTPPAVAGSPEIDSAVERFRAGDYADALTLVDGVLQGRPSDAAAHELRALILFAMKDYSQAAATIHSVLAVGPGWNWTTLSSLYPDMQLYTAQLGALQAYVNTHPRQAEARFLLAYHEMTAGHADVAATQLEKVVGLMPDDKLAADLLRMMDRDQAKDPPPVAQSEPDPAASPVDAAMLAGAWHASREDGSTFDLDLLPDKTFTWKFSQGEHKETIAGTYSVDKALLIMQGKTGGSMVGQVSSESENRFTFKAVGGPPDDMGLTFTR